jgi:hypothetical protein
MFYYYYITALVSCVLFLYCVKFLNIKLTSFSFLSYVASFILIILPGYFVSSGELLPASLQRGFDFDVFLLYLTFSILLPVGLLSGNVLGQRVRLGFQARRGVSLNVFFVLSLITIYSVMYFKWLPSIPFNEIFSEGVGARDLVDLRVSITHQLGENEQLPFLFRYWRNILQNFFLVVFLFYYAESEKKKSIYKAFVFIVFCYLAYCHIFTMEKAPIIFVIAAIFITRSFVFLPNMKNMIKYAFIISIMIVFMYVYFMSVPFDLVLANIFRRLAVQSASVYVAVEYLRECGFLWFQGVPMPILNRILDLGFVDMGEITYKLIYPQFADTGTVGSAGGMSLAQLYYAFSWFCIPIFLFISVLYGWFDRVLVNSVCFCTDGAEKNLAIAFYATFCSKYCMAMVSTVFLLFSFPIIFNPSFLLLISLFFVLFKVGKLRLYHVS